VSAFGDMAARAAAEHGDGLWITGAAAETVQQFRDAGGSGPVYSQITVCWAGDKEQAIDTAHRIWPNPGLPGQLAQDLRTIAHFEDAVKTVSRDSIARDVPTGPDPESYLQAAKEAVAAGVDHLYFHQIGPDQEGFLRFWDEELRDLVKAM
ncbi:MAG: LLM class flavin-dependent oxidoreductase, partial [Acidimicrobiia bacterium]|nr:LLM class flavin-dependent oxidoreductase [Acidimicrobiia bacterium]